MLASKSIKNFTGGLKLTPTETEALQQLPTRLENVPADHDLVHAGDRPNKCITIVSGFANTSKRVAGQRRQFAAFHVPGDMPDLMSLHLETMDCDIRTSTACQVEYVTHADLLNICVCFPRLGFAFWRATLLDAAIMRDWVVNLARRPALSRLAHFFCEMMVRLEAVGLADEFRCRLPLTQEDLSDVTGLSVVHVNRTLQVLRATGFMLFNDGNLVILEWEKLAALANFDDGYLHLSRNGSDCKLI